MRTVSRLAVTPVKALALLHPGSVRLEPFGVAENRRFYLIDDIDKLASGSRHGRLVQIRAEYDLAEERLRLTFPDGATAQGRADQVTGDRLVTDFYGRPVEGHVVMGPFSDAISDWYGQPLRLARTDRPGSANDVHALSLMSTASARALATATGSDRPLETRRFRMLLELEDRKSTRLNSSHRCISYAVFCLKKKTRST